MRLLAAFAIVLAGLCFAAAPAEPGTVTVFAAASLREAFEAAAPAFTRKTGLALRFDFGGSDALATQIAQGAPADVFASANTAQMDRLRVAGLLASTPRTFARNRLVVIVPAKNPANIATPEDLGRPGVRLVLAAPTVPIGAYARQALQRAGAGIAARANANVISEELDVKAVVTKIALGEGDAGICYATDVTPAVAKDVRVIPISEELAPSAGYPIATIKGATNVAGGQAFIDFMRSTAGAKYLHERGFLGPG